MQSSRPLRARFADGKNPPMHSLFQYGAVERAQLTSRREVSRREVVEAHLARIEEHNVVFPRRSGHSDYAAKAAVGISTRTRWG
jgi:hypothetical protein